MRSSADMYESGGRVLNRSHARSHQCRFGKEVPFSRQEPVALTENLPRCFCDLKSSSAVVARDMLSTIGTEATRLCEIHYSHSFSPGHSLKWTEPHKSLVPRTPTLGPEFAAKIHGFRRIA